MTFYTHNSIIKVKTGFSLVIFNGYSDRALEFLCGDGRKFQKDNQAFMVEWPDESHSSVKGT
jgi:hypothetical protein